MEGNTIVMPVFIPDGTSATLRFPRSLDLSEMGLTPEVGYYLEGEGVTGELDPREEAFYLGDRLRRRGRLGGKWGCRRRWRGLGERSRRRGRRQSGAPTVRLTDFALHLRLLLTTRRLALAGPETALRWRPRANPFQDSSDHAKGTAIVCR